MYYRLVMKDFLGAMAARPFQALGLTPAEIEVFLVGVRKHLNDLKYHTYLNYVFWTAQKPGA